MQESKEKISSRMIKNASRLWGFNDTQSESSFDPVVGLILGALASELAKISTDINTVEARILEKLVDLLTPEPITGPFPAHALLRAKSIDPSFRISSDYQFYTNKRYLKPGDHTAHEKPLFFTPAGDYKLFNGELKYLVSASKIFKFEEQLEKEIVAVGRSSRSIKTSELWLGVELHKDLESLDGLSFCFDLRNEAYEESFYESLAKGRWTINNQVVHFNQGLINNMPEANSLDALLQQELDITTKVNSHINRYYHNKFQTLSDSKFKPKLPFTDKNIPDEFSKIYSLEDLQLIEENLLWIKVEFPQILSPEIFDDLFCSINCFPAINRRLNEFTQSSREFINIIPLLTEEVFFGMKRVSSSEGKLFVEKSFSGIGDVDSGSFIVRHGGVGRFDSRNAAEIVGYLLELLRDESAAFSIIGADMISSDLKELNQTIARLENRLTESNVVKKDISYLLLKSHPEDDTLFVEFWTTNGDFGNKIKSGENLFIYEGSGLSPDSVVTITSTVGGREKMDTEDRINAYRKALLSHGRVVTKEDIKALCFEHFGKLLKSVEVKKGLQTGQSTDSGFIQTHDIVLTLKKQADEISKEELKFLKKDLLIKLEEQSASVLPFRCFIEENRG
jgi:hypothetical protein